jgi:murein DD-endopeptidase MepM/ murein hydrolase activator NlpD
MLPTSWKATHQTDGLGWGTKTATDIMAKPGTLVGAPEDGVVLKWNPTGAQGGGSMYFKAASGRLYWIGHVANGLKPGSRVKRGQTLAAVSSDHPRPHVHLDAQ